MQSWCHKRSSDEPGKTRYLHVPNVKTSSLLLGRKWKSNELKLITKRCHFVMSKKKININFQGGKLFCGKIYLNMFTDLPMDSLLTITISNLLYHVLCTAGKLAHLRNAGPIGQGRLGLSSLVEPVTSTNRTKASRVPPLPSCHVVCQVTSRTLCIRHQININQ